MNSLRQLAWRDIRRRIGAFTPVRTAAFAGVLLLLLIGGYAFQWTGFDESLRTVEGDQDLQRAKTLWDWLELAIVPIALAGGAYLLNQEATRRARAAEEASSRENALREERLARENALQQYLGRIGELMIEYDVHAPSEESLRIRTFMRALTLSVLRSFGPERNEESLNTGVPSLESLRPDLRKEVLRFLYQARLIDASNPIVDLAGADLTVADLSLIDLSGANLSGANLSGADLTLADLTNARLRNCDLTGAVLLRARMAGAALQGARLEGAIGAG